MLYPFSRSSFQLAKPPGTAARRRIGATGGLVFFAIAPALTQPHLQNSTASATAATATAPRMVTFAPGVRINWTSREIELDAEVVLRGGPLELFAGSGHMKDHETILNLAARPLHIHQALGLIGLEPGRPSWWDEESDTVHPPTGDPVDVYVRYAGPDGRTVMINACDWMLDMTTDKPLRRTHWVFAGSVKLEGGRFGADLYGTVITVVDFGTSVLSIIPPGTPLRPVSAPVASTSQAASEPQEGAVIADEQHVDQPTDLALLARTRRIPPLGTHVIVILKPARESEAALQQEGEAPLWEGEAPAEPLKPTPLRE